MSRSEAGRRPAGLPVPRLRMRTTSGLELAADVWGPPDGAPVLLLHGGGQTRHAWKRAGQTLGEHGFHALAYDARGHGDSSWSPERDYSDGALAADLREVSRQHAGARPCVLVGASMGGLTALAALGRRELEAAALVLVDVVPRVEPAGLRRIVEFMESGRAGFASLDEMADAIAAYQPHRTRPASSEGVAKNARLGPDGRYRWHWDPAVTPRVDLSELGDRYASYAANVTVPTLLVRGAMSDVVRDAGVRDLLRLLPHAEFVEVAGAAHMVAGDDNDVFVDRIVEFLDRHGAVSEHG